MLTVVCVLKSGGDYSPIYVEKLRSAVYRNLHVPHKFVCYTDLPEEVSEICEVRPLVKNLQGWWSKVEMFNEVGPTIYFDLDTFILKSVDSLANHLNPGAFFMLSPFSQNNELWASGVMAWNGDFSYINYEFIWDQYSYLNWDQRYIVQKLLEREVVIHPVQAYLEGVKSYKFHCIKYIVEGTSVVCFHGKGTRPHTITEGWVPEIWNAD